MTTFSCAWKSYARGDSVTRSSRAKEWKSRSRTQPEPNKLDFSPTVPLALKNRGFAAVPHDGLICNDNGRSGFNGVVDLVSKLRIDAETLSEFLGGNTAAPARHSHPSPTSAARSKGALPVARAFEQRVNMVPK